MFSDVKDFIKTFPVVVLIVLALCYNSYRVLDESISYSKNVYCGEVILKSYTDPVYKSSAHYYLRVRFDQLESNRVQDIYVSSMVFADKGVGAEICFHEGFNMLGVSVGTVNDPKYSYCNAFTIIVHALCMFCLFAGLVALIAYVLIVLNNLIGKVLGSK